MTLTNGLSRADVGFFSYEVDDGGRSDLAPITSNGTSGVRAVNDALFENIKFVDVGGNGGAFGLHETTVTQTATQTLGGLVESRGSFMGTNGLITWRVTTQLAQGSLQVVNTVEFNSANPFGAVNFIDYLDEDVLGVSDDILYAPGVPGSPSFQAFTLDGPERIGFSQGGVYDMTDLRLQNATWLGWAADEYDELETAIRGTGTSFTPAGNIDTSDLPPFNDPLLGQVFGAEDVTTAFAWALNPTSTTATITTFLTLNPMATDFDGTPGTGNSPPTVALPIADVVAGLGAPDVTRSLSGVFADVDIATNGDMLSLDATSSNPGLVAVRMVGETLTLSFTPGQRGTATVTVRATDRANASVATTFDVVVSPVIAGTTRGRGPQGEDDLFVIDLDPADPTFLRVRRNDEDPIRISLIAQAGVTIDGERGNDRFVINLAGLPNLVPGRPFTLIVAGGTGIDRMNLLGLPAIPGVDLVLDGETSDLNAPSVGGDSGDVLDLSRLPGSAQIVAYNDSRYAGAIGLEYRDGPSVAGFSLRNFGSTTGLASDRSVELVGDNGVGTVFGSGIAQSDRISVRATGFRQFTAGLNGATPLRFTAPRLALRGKLLSDAFEITPLSGNAWGVSVEVEGSDSGDFSAVGATPGAGDILTLIDLDPQSNEISVSDGGISSESENGLSFVRIDTIGVRPSEAAGSVPNTLKLTDSTADRTFDVDLGASGVVDGTTYDPIVVLSGRGVVARHGVALATETGEDDILLDLKGGGHVVNVNVSHTRGNTGRNVAIQGDGTDKLNVTVEGNPRFRQFDRVVRFSNPSVRRRFTIIRVRYAGRGHVPDHRDECDAEYAGPGWKEGRRRAGGPAGPRREYPGGSAVDRGPDGPAHDWTDPIGGARDGELSRGVMAGVAGPSAIHEQESLRKIHMIDLQGYGESTSLITASVIRRAGITTQARPRAKLRRRWTCEAINPGRTDAARTPADCPIEPSWKRWKSVCYWRRTC